MRRSYWSNRLLKSFGVLALVVGMTSMFGADSGCPGNTVPTPTPTPTPTPQPPAPQPGQTPGTNVAPLVEFSSPFTHMTIQDGTAVQISYTVTDPENRTRVSIFADGVDSSTSPPTEFTMTIVAGQGIEPGVTSQTLIWNTTGSAAAVYTLRATADDGVNTLTTASAAGTVTILPRPPPPAPPPPPPPPPNLGPTFRLVRPVGANLRFEAGDPIDIEFETADFEDSVLVNVTAELDDSDPAVQIPLVVDRLQPSGVVRDSVVWDTTGIEIGSWTVTLTADEVPADPTQTPNPSPPPIAFVVTITDPGTSGQENSAPIVEIVFPTTDAGLTDGDELDLTFFLADQNSLEDTISLIYYLDTDLDPSNDAESPPIRVGGDTITPIDFLLRLVPPGGFVQVPLVPVFPGEPFPPPAIKIDVKDVPVRDETDEAGRPLPYYIRIHADDGEGGVIDEYAPGSIRITQPSSDVVDLLKLGSRFSGAIFQGFNGEPFSEGRGSRAGSAITPLGDLDADGIADFAIAAQRATPFNRNGVGMVYVVYGRDRRIDPFFEFGFVQGRYAGVLDLNGVGVFANNIPVVFKIRGTQMFHPSVGPGGSAGITALTNWNDITGDGLPELVISCLYADSVRDTEDDDPCDECSLPSPPYPVFICMDLPEPRPAGPGDEPISGDVVFPAGLIRGEDEWIPTDPDAPPALANCLLDVDETEHITGIGGLGLLVSGTGTGGPPDDFVELQFVFQLDITVDRGDGTVIRGPQFASRIFLVETDQNGDFDFDELGFLDTVGGALPAPWGEETLTNPAPLSDIAFQDIPPSVWDGRFNAFVKFVDPPNPPGSVTNPPGPPGVEVEYDSFVVQVFGATAEEAEEYEFDVDYGDGFPDAVSNGNCTDPVVNIVGAGELPPVCPPLNDDRFSNVALSGYFCLPLQLAGVIFIPLGPENDELFDNPLVDPRYQSGIVYVAGSNALSLPAPGGLWGGQGQRTAEIGQYGQGPGTPEGARFRGAWFQPDNPRIYDPRSRFGTSLDTIEDINASNPPLDELIVSAPGSGLCSQGGYDLTADFGGIWNPGDARIVKYNLLDSLNGSLTDCNLPPTPWTFDNFSRVTGAAIILTGSANRAARVQVQVMQETPFGIVPIPGTARVLLLWPGDNNIPNGDYEIVEHIDAWFGFDPFPVAPPTPPLPPANPLVMLFPRGALGLFSATDYNQTSFYIELRVLDDCATTNDPATVPMDQTTVNITSASFAVAGLAPDVGQVIVYEGQVWTNGDDGSDGDKESEDRPQSWPATECDEVTLSRLYGTTEPSPVTRLIGQFPNDRFGWGSNAGDLDGDGNSDIGCGAPGSDNDPNNAGGPALTDNGMAVVVFGRLALGSGQIGPPFERFEVRGTHDGDEFGQRQGNAGDFAQNQTDQDDTFIAAPLYDVDGMGGLPTIGADAGFVGIIFGGTINTGETTIRAERIGTAQFPGIKFVGGSPGALLGDAVSSAGDYNQDGFEDLLITAPGQTWPGVRIRIMGDVADGEVVVINGKAFEFDTDGQVTLGAKPVDVSDGVSPEIAQPALLAAAKSLTSEDLGASAMVSRMRFPDGVPNDPAISLLSRTSTWAGVQSTSPNIVPEDFIRQGVTYLIFGNAQSRLENNIYVLPDDLNRRDSNGDRVLKGIVIVGGYEPDDPNPANGPYVVQFDPGTITVATVATDGLATFAGGIEGDPGNPNRILARSAPNAYVVTSPDPAIITFPETRPICQVAAYFAYDPDSGATGATIRAFGVDGNQLLGLTFPAIEAPLAGTVPPPPLMVIRGSGQFIARLEIEVQGPPGSIAVLDDVVLEDGTPDQAAVTVVTGVGDVDGDGFADLMLGAPTGDFVDDRSPCDRRRSAGEVYLIYGNEFGLNKLTQP